jgi:hypothetical protein
MYPNPFDRSLHIKGPAELVDDFRLYDVNGKLIMSADKVRLEDLPDLSPGIYYNHL